MQFFLVFARKFFCLFHTVIPFGHNIHNYIIHCIIAIVSIFGLKALSKKIIMRHNSRKNRRAWWYHTYKILPFLIYFIIITFFVFIIFDLLFEFGLDLFCLIIYYLSLQRKIIGNKKIEWKTQPTHTHTYAQNELLRNISTIWLSRSFFHWTNICRMNHINQCHRTSFILRETSFI